MPRRPTTEEVEVMQAKRVDLGNMFICSHQGRMQYLMGRELVNEDNKLIIFSDLEINLEQLVSENLNSEEVGPGAGGGGGGGEGRTTEPADPHADAPSSPNKINLLFDKLPPKIQKPAEALKTKSLYDYFMCSSYIKFKNCAILRLKFEPITDSTGTKLRIELIHEGSLEKDEEIVTNTKEEAIYWVKGSASQEKGGLNANQICEFPTLELILGDSEKFNIQGDIFVMRHGYSEHNRAKMDGSKKFYSDLTDAALTPAGVKQCVEAAEAFKILSDNEIVPSEFDKYCCSDLRRTWQSLSAFNSQRGVSGVDGNITMLPYMHEFEYKSIIPYGADDAFLTKGYLAAGGKLLGRASYLAAGVGLGAYLGAAPLAAAGAKAVVGKALASKVGVAATSAGKTFAGKIGGTAAASAKAAAAGLQVPNVTAGGIAATTGIVGATLDQYGTRADDKSEKGIRGFFKKPSTFKNYSKVRRRRMPLLPRGAMEYKRKGQVGGMKEGMARVALGEAGKGQFIRMLATENRSKLRGQGVFVGTEFTAEIPQLNTVTINTDFYRTIKSGDPVLQQYRYTFFGILIACNNHIITPTENLSKKDLKPKDKRRLASFRRSLESKGSGQEKVSSPQFIMGQGGGYRKTHRKKTKKKTRKRKNKTRRKKISKKNRGTKMRNKKTHKRTKKNKKNKINP